MKRALAIGVVVLLVAAVSWIVWGGRGRDEPRRPGSSRTKAAAPLRWSGGDAGDVETRVTNARPGAIAGRVIDAIDAAPIAGATVTLRTADGEELDETSSEEDGTFSFEEAGAAVLVAASAPGYAIHAEDLDAESGGVGERGITLELDGAVTVSGVVVDPAGDPVADAEVWIEDGERAYFRPPSVSGTVRTDAGGRFAVEDSPSGTLIAHAEHPDFASARVEIGALGPGRDKGDVRIELADTGALSGRALDESGAPAGGAAMTWMPVERQRWRELEVTTVAADDGRYRFPHLPEGKGLVRATTDSGDGAVEAVIAVGTEATADVVVHAEPVFRGEVVDGAERPVAGARVAVGFAGDDENRGPALARAQRRRGERSETVTDAKGRFSLHAPGDDAVRLFASTSTASGSAEVAPGSGPVRITLRGIGIARVHVVGADGKPYVGEGLAAVEGDSPGAGGHWGAKQRLSRGTAVFQGTPGEWRFRVLAGDVRFNNDEEAPGFDDEAPGFPEGEIAAQVSAVPPETDVTIRVAATSPPRSTVRGRIAGPDGKPVVAARVSVLAESRDWRGASGARLDWKDAVRSDAAGRFTLTAPAGTQKLFVYHPEFRSEIATVVVPSEGEGDAGVIRLDTGSGASAVYEFSGIGAVLSQDDQGRCVITDVVAGGPAQRAGIRAKDIVLEIDGAALHGMSLGDVVGRIRGPVGTTVSLRLERPGNLEPFVIDVLREKIRT